MEPSLRLKPYISAEELQAITEWTDDPVWSLEYEPFLTGDRDGVTKMLADTYCSQPDTNIFKCSLEDMQIPDLCRRRNVDLSTGSRMPGNLDAAPSTPRNFHNVNAYPSSSTDQASSRLYDEVLAKSPGFQSDPYDCGWDDPEYDQDVAIGEDGDCYYGGWDGPKDSINEAMPPCAEDAYDCGWDVQPNPLEEPGPPDTEDLYDCGWDCTPDPTDEPEPPGAEDAYDCGWGDAMHPTDVTQEGLATAEPDDCGFDQKMDVDETLPVATTESGDQYDCGWDAATDPPSGEILVGRQDVIDLVSSSASTGSDDPYDCGWDAIGDNPLDAEAVKRPDVIDLTSPAKSRSLSPCRASGQRIQGTAKPSPGGASQVLGKVTDKGRNMLVRNMVAPNTRPTQGRIPALAFGVYGAAKDRVAEFGKDMIELYQLLDMHRRILDPLDAIIANIESGKHGRE